MRTILDPDGARWIVRVARPDYLIVTAGLYLGATELIVDADGAGEPVWRTARPYDRVSMMRRLHHAA